MSGPDLSALVIACIVFGFCVGGLVFRYDGKDTIKKQAIENSCAQYNPSTGVFEWVKR